MQKGKGGRGAALVSRRAIKRGYGDASKAQTTRGPTIGHYMEMRAAEVSGKETRIPRSNQIPWQDI